MPSARLMAMPASVTVQPRLTTVDERSAAAGLMPGAAEAVLGVLMRWSFHPRSGTWRFVFLLGGHWAERGGDESPTIAGRRSEVRILIFMHNRRGTENLRLVPT